MWGAAISAVGSLYGAKKGADEAEGGYGAAAGISKKARKKITKANDTMRKENRMHLNAEKKAKDRLSSEQESFIRSETAPWRAMAEDSMGQIRQGIADGRFDPGEFQFNLETFQQDPSYQFRFDETMKAMEKGGAARGKRLSGEQLMALQERGGQLASQEYGSAWQRAFSEHELKRQQGADDYSRLVGAQAIGQQGQNQYLQGMGNIYNNRLAAEGQYYGGLRNVNDNWMNTYASAITGDARARGNAAIGAGQAAAQGWADMAGAMNTGIENIMVARGT